MQINLTENGNLPNDCPEKFFRVEAYAANKRIADFTDQDEAKMFAISHAKANGYKFDHKVATIRLVAGA
jgi:hypothetical protein